MIIRILEGEQSTITNFQIKYPAGTTALSTSESVEYRVISESSRIPIVFKKPHGEIGSLAVDFTRVPDNFSGNSELAFYYACGVKTTSVAFKIKQ